MVLDDYLQWLDNNYGKKNMLAKQKSQDKLRVEATASQQKTVDFNPTVSSKPVITTQQIAEQLNTTKIKE